MFSLSLDCTQETRDLLIADLWDLGSEGIVETATGLRAFFDASADRAELVAQFPDAVMEDAEDRDWVAESRELLQPMVVGQRFFLLPEWRDDPAPDGRVIIRINSGQAFGTGAHETTRLCLEWLEELVQPGQTIVDIGTGSGILAIAARHLGAGRVIACDIDATAAAVARVNFEAAGFGDIESFSGSIQKIAPNTADLLIANISPEWLIQLAAEFKRVAKRQARVLLSGLEEQDVERVSARLAAAGIHVEAVRPLNTWRALLAHA